MAGHLLTVSMILAFAAPANNGVAEKPSRVERIADGVLLVRDDLGAWGGSSMGMTHQRGPDYQAQKILDLSGVAEADWQAATRVRLSAYFCVRDYSWHDAKKTNGLDEFIEIVSLL